MLRAPPPATIGDPGIGICGLLPPWSLPLPAPDSDSVPFSLGGGALVGGVMPGSIGASEGAPGAGGRVVELVDGGVGCGKSAGG